MWIKRILKIKLEKKYKRWINKKYGRKCYGYVKTSYGEW